MTDSDPDPVTCALPSGRERWWWVALLALAFALRLAAVIEYEARHPHADSPVIDEASYDSWAREIADGDWLGDEVFFQEPLYPYALGTIYAVTGDSRTAARSVQVVLGVLSVWLVRVLARRTFGRRAGWVAGISLALNPVAVLMPCLLLKPNLFVPLFAGLCIAFVGDRNGSTKRWIAIGVLGGLGALLRGNLLILLPAIGVWPLVRMRSMSALKPMAAFALGVGFVLAPVAIRNQVVGGVFALTTSGAGTNLYGGNSLENEYGVATEFSWVRGVPEHEALDWRVEAERRTGTSLDGGETSRFWIRELADSLRAHPLAHLAILWNKLRLTLGSYEVADNHFQGWDARYVQVLRWPLPGWGVSGALGIAGLLGWVALRRTSETESRRRGDLLALIFVAYLCTIVLTVTSMRARFPLVVPLLPFAGLFIDRGFQALRSRNVPRIGAFAGLLLIAAVCVHVPVFGAGQSERDCAERDHNLAVAMLESGRAAEALPIADELSRRHPRSARLTILDVAVRAEVVFDEITAGAPRDAGRVAVLQSCLNRLQAIYDEPGVSPRERARSAGVAGRIQAGLGQTAKAERQVRRAREFMRGDADLLATHARLLSTLIAAEPSRAPELDAVIDSVLEDLNRYGDPEAWSSRINAVRSQR